MHHLRPTPSTPRKPRVGSRRTDQSHPNRCSALFLSAARIISRSLLLRVGAALFGRLDGPMLHQGAARVARARGAHNIALATIGAALFGSAPLCSVVSMVQCSIRGRPE